MHTGVTVVVIRASQKTRSPPWMCTVAISWLGGIGGTASINGGSDGGGGGGSDSVLWVSTATFSLNHRSFKRNTQSHDSVRVAAT